MQKGMWYEGVVVACSPGQWYSIFFASDQAHEMVKLPDATVALRLVSAGEHQAVWAGGEVPVSLLPPM